MSGEESAVYKLLLQVNGLWRETGGSRMGLDGVNGNVSQIYEFALAAVDLEGLQGEARGGLRFEAPFPACLDKPIAPAQRSIKQHNAPACLGDHHTLRALVDDDALDAVFLRLREDAPGAWTAST